MRKKQLLLSVLLMALVLFLAACGSSSNDGAGQADAGDSENVDEQAVEREMLDLTYEITAIDEANGTLQASMETNLPADTVIYRLVLKNDEGKDSFVAYEFTIDEENVVSFALKGADKAALLDKEYQLSLELNVTERTNTDLSTNEEFGGSFEDMDAAYAESENVLVKEVGVDEAYTITLTSSNKAMITEEHFVVE